MNSQNFYLHIVTNSEFRKKLKNKYLKRVKTERGSQLFSPSAAGAAQGDTTLCLKGLYFNIILNKTYSNSNHQNIGK